MFKNSCIKTFFLFFLLSGLFVSTGCFFKNDTETLKQYDAGTIAAINAMIDSGMQGVIPGTVAGIWQDGYETLLVARGKADIVSGRAANALDKFRIASNSKVFTATGILMLADEKKLDIDDKVSKYLPELLYGDQITIRQVANHTSGYPNYTEEPAFSAALIANPLKTWTPQELIDAVKSKPLNFNPGSKYTYSNTGYIILGMIIEKVSGKSWSDFMTERIFRPLMLADTYCPTGAAVAGTNVMKGYVVNGTTSVEFAADASAAWAAGGIVSTVSDMKKWLSAIASGAFLSPRMRDEQKKWVATGENSEYYGFGLWLVKGQYIGHTGNIPGFNSAAFISQDGKKAIVLVNNLDWKAKETAVKLMDYLF